MWSSLTRCSIIGGVIVFLWLMASWMIFPMHQMAINSFTDQGQVADAITKYAPDDGIYVLPSMDYDKESGVKDGTFLFVNLRRDVNFSNMAKPMVLGFITQVVGAFLITYLLLNSKAKKYWSRVSFVTIIGLIVALLGTVPSMNWWHFPLGWGILEMFDILIGWFLGGLVIAKLIK